MVFRVRFIQRGTEYGEFVLVAQALQIQIQIQGNKTQIVVDHYFPCRNPTLNTITVFVLDFIS